MHLPLTTELGDGEDESLVFWIGFEVLQLLLSAHHPPAFEAENLAVLLEPYVLKLVDHTSPL